MKKVCARSVLGLSLAAGCLPPAGNPVAVDSAPVLDLTLLLSAGQTATAPVGELPGLWVRLELSSVEVLRPYGGLSHPDGRGEAELIGPDDTEAGQAQGCGRLSDAGDDLVWVRDALGGDGEVQVRLWPLAPGEEAECPG